MWLRLYPTVILCTRNKKSNLPAEQLNRSRRGVNVAEGEEEGVERKGGEEYVEEKKRRKRGVGKRGRVRRERRS